MSRTAIVEKLRADIAVIERRNAVATLVPLGLPDIDACLPQGGLARGAVHELRGSAASGFAAMLAGRVTGAVLWCIDAGTRANLYGPGLAAFGLNPQRLIVVRCPNRTDMLWAMEEGLSSPELGAVIGEPDGTVDLAASRRLQLAAEAGGVLGMVLARGPGQRQHFAPSALESRWQVDAAPALAHNRTGPCWQVALGRCRGMPQREHATWMVERDGTTGHFIVADASAGRPADPGLGQAPAGQPAFAAGRHG